METTSVIKCDICDEPIEDPRRYSGNAIIPTPVIPQGKLDITYCVTCIPKLREIFKAKLQPQRR